MRGPRCMRSRLSAQEASEKFLFKMMSLFVSSPVAERCSKDLDMVVGRRDRFGFHGHVVAAFCLRSLQELAQRPTSDGRCSGASSLSVATRSKRFYSLYSPFKDLGVSMRLPPIDEAEQADLPEVLVAIQQPDGTHGGGILVVHCPNRVDFERRIDSKYSKTMCFFTKKIPKWPYATFDSG